MSEARASQRSLTQEEWLERFDAAGRALDRLDRELGLLTAWADKAGGATGADRRERNRVIHSACGALGSLMNQRQLIARRRERGLL